VDISKEREQAIRDRFINNNPFPKLLGIELDSIQAGSATLSVETSDRLLQVQGIMHGGAIASLIDTAVALAIAGVSQPEDRYTTVEMKVNYLSPIKRGRATAHAKIIKNGRRIIVAECDVTDADNSLVAKGLLTYIRLSQR
jgi:uncharacterized protein (TIGR00369 family)